jgi:hypothetical protein
MLRAACPADLPAIAAVTAYYVEHTAIHFAYRPAGPAVITGDRGTPGP